MNATVVTIVVNGALVIGSTPAELRDGVVMAPLDPYVRTLATAISPPFERTIVVKRAGRTIRLRVGSREIEFGGATRLVPVAPFLRAGTLYVPLGIAARALGATVSYDGRGHTLAIALPELPIATLAPAPLGTPPPTDLPTFAPTPTPAPVPTISGIPKPRRTPIPIGSGG
jgi:hypothetical protein